PAVPRKLHSFLAATQKWCIHLSGRSKFQSETCGYLEILQTRWCCQASQRTRERQTPLRKAKHCLRSHQSVRPVQTSDIETSPQQRHPNSTAFVVLQRTETLLRGRSPSDRAQ